MKKIYMLFTALAVSIVTTFADPFTAGNIVIYRTGSGTGSLVNTGNPVFLDEYTPAGALVQSIALPTTASGSNFPLISSGTATSEGNLTLSTNRNFLILTGYGSTIPAASPLPSTSGSTVPRVVGRVDANGVINTTTALSDFANGNNPRSAISTNGSDIWVAGGAGGPRYTTLGSTTSTQISTSFTNLRQLNIFDGQLYVSSGSGTLRVGTIGTGMPTTLGQTITNLPGFPTSSTSPYGYVLLDQSSAVAGVDVLYIASDDLAGISKYSLVSGNWVFNGNIGVATDAYRGLTARYDGTTATFFSTRKGASVATGGGELVTFTDASGYNATFSATVTVLATTTANTAFRGVAFAPGTIILPVSILSFDAKKTVAGNEINWTVADQTNLSHYEIERSKDGKNFANIGRVNANNGTNYSFTDATPINATNYYRLKIVDKDGTSKVSKLVAVINKGKGAIVTGVYPTITTGKLTIDVAAEGTQPLQFVFIDLQGRTATIKNVTAITGNNTISLDASALASGMYLVKVLQGNTEATSFKIVKQ